MKKQISVLMILSFILFSTVAPSAQGIVTFNTERIEAGVLGIQYQVSDKFDTRIMLENNGQRKTFLLPADRADEHIPLTLGDGIYSVSILEQISGNQYRPIRTESLQVNISDETGRYLSSVQEIRWTSDSLAVKKAKTLTEDLTTDLEKVKAIHDYVVRHITYDYAKPGQITSRYLPDIDETFIAGSGICYDYASLFAAMLRSVGVPSRMAKGYAPGVDEYHAWNEVLVDGQWQTVDTTFDAAYYQAGISTDMFKNSDAFTVSSII